MLIGLFNLQDINEIATLAKFIIITAIILPILPQDNIHQYFSVAFYKIWLAVVVVKKIILKGFGIVMLCNIIVVAILYML